MRRGGRAPPTATAARGRSIRLGPGELLLFDNLATAHGRLGARNPLELNQRCVGYPRLDARQNAMLLSRILESFRGERR